MKRVILIPVIHDLADLGSLADSVRAHYTQRLGPAAWEQRQRAVAKLWGDIRRGLDALRLDWPRARIYQDGLPICGKEEQITRELAGAGSLNHQLVLELMHKGATLVGTEDPQLLIREYQLQREQLAAAAGGAKPSAATGDPIPAAPPGDSNPSPAPAAAELLSARDRFIAQRIAATLADDETGLLFLGAAHRIDGLLRAQGIEVAALGKGLGGGLGS
jgi:hypothetical protein